MGGNPIFFVFLIRTTMGGSLSDLAQRSKDRNTQARLDEMARDKGIKFPQPGEVLTEVPNFDNAGDAMLWMMKLSRPQIKQIKDMPFRIAGRRPLSIMDREKISPLSADSITKLESGNAIQEVIQLIKNKGEGAEVLIGANRGGKIPPMIGCQQRVRGRGGF